MCRQILDFRIHNVSDSFVRTHKRGRGSGEARFYVGSGERSVNEFFSNDFNDRNTLYRGKIGKINIVEYLVSATLTEIEQEEALQLLRELDDDILFDFRSQNGEGERKYINDSDSSVIKGFEIFRNILTPGETNLLILKENNNNEIYYRFIPFLNEHENRVLSKYRNIQRELEIDEMEREIENSDNMGETEKYSIIQSRQGQGIFRDRCIQRYTSKCAITELSNIEILEAAHIKPWSECDNQERLDPNNSILLTSTLHKLFDRGYFTFDSDLEIIVSESLDEELTELMDYFIENNNIAEKLEGSEEYLRYHYQEVFISE